MAVKGRVRQLILRISSIRIESRKKRDERKLREACNQEARRLDGLLTCTVGFGIDGASTSHEAPAENRCSISSIGIGFSHSVEDHGSQSTEEDLDPRFIMNPIGIGSSRNFENPYPEATEDMDKTAASILTAFRGFSFECDNAKMNDRLSTSEPQESVFDPRLWAGPGSIRVDWEEGKGKGRAKEAEAGEIEMMRHWLAHDESGNVLPQDETREKLLAFMGGKAWTL